MKAIGTKVRSRQLFVAGLIATLAAVLWLLWQLYAPGFIDETHDDALDRPKTLLMLIQESGSLQFFILLIVALGIFHLTLSIRTLTGRRESDSPCFHVLLLFSEPCILLYAVLATILPALVSFLYGYCNPSGVREAMGAAFALVWVSCVLFVSNVILSLLVLRSSRKKTEPS